MKAAAVVILYHPTYETFNNIKSYHHWVERIYVTDNTEEQESCIANILKSFPKIQYHSDKRNEGIAKRLNEAAKMAINDGFDWLLLMDQDSAFKEDTFKEYVHLVNNYRQKQNVAMFAVAFNEHKDIKQPDNLLIGNFITSGTFLNLNAFTKLGGFDENLFIDGVDHDYVVRAIVKKLPIVQFNAIHLHHNLGEVVHRSSIKTLFFVKKRKRIHSPLRCYYMYRNYLYLEKKWVKDDLASLQKLKTMTKANIINALFYGRKSLALLKYLYLAKLHFKANKMGKYSK